MLIVGFIFFTQVEYSMNEGLGVAQVCLELELESPTGDPIMASISASDSTALGRFIMSLKF